MQDRTLRRYAQTMTVAAVVSLVPYLAVLWNLRLDPLRTALPSGQFSNFYDAQARAFLHGSIAVPKGILGIEAFVVAGREQMYFPPGPALARIPILLLTDRYDGFLTAPSMLLAWLASAVMITLLAWRVRHMLRGAAPMGRAEAVAFGLLLVGSTAGSVLLYLGSLPWVYHEAYAWSTVMALGFAFCLLGVIQRPTSRGVLATGMFMLGAILCRATSGWACAGAAGLTAVWFLSGRQGAEAMRQSRGLLLASLLAVGVGVAINEARFDHPYLFPLQDQVWTHVNEQRRRALDANGGDLVSLDILPSTALSYFRPDGIRVINVFPYLTLPAKPARAVDDAVLDQTYRTGSVVAFMPGLSLLAAWGIFTAFRRRAPGEFALVRVPLLGSLAIGGAVMFYGYIAYRYTSDLLPGLVLAATIGLVDVARRLDPRPVAWRKRALLGLAVLVAFGVAANFAAGFTTGQTSSSGSGLRHYVAAQDRISSWTPGDPIGHFVSRSVVLPHDQPADHLQIVGNCDALYISTGDTFWPWMPVELHRLAFEVRVNPAPAGDTRDITLAEVVGYPDQMLRIQRQGDQRYRLLYVDGKDITAGPWSPMPSDGVFYITVRPDLKDDAYVVGADGRYAFSPPISRHNAKWFREQYLYEPSILVPEDLADVGLQVRPLDGKSLETCRRLQRFRP